MLIDNFGARKIEKRTLGQITLNFLNASTDAPFSEFRVDLFFADDHKVLIIFRAPNNFLPAIP